MEKTRSVRADLVHFDLEDSVAQADKEEARLALLRAAPECGDLRVAVRVNPLSTIDGLRDLVFLVDHRILPEVVILAKASLPAHVEQASSVLRPHRLDLRLFAVVESAAGLCQLRQMRERPEALIGVVFGSADFSADLGTDPDGADLLWVRRELALEAHRLGLVLIDAPCFRIDRPERLARELGVASELGFEGKIAIHPSQVAAINAHFTPSREELERAAELIDEQEASQGAIVRVGGRAVGPPHIEHSRRLLARASRLRAADGDDVR